MSYSNCCFLTCIQFSQEAGQVVWYSHLFQNFPQFIVIHTVKGFGIVDKAEIDVFWNSVALLMIQWMLAIWFLVPLPFLKPAWTSGSSWFTYCWSLCVGCRVEGRRLDGWMKSCLLLLCELESSPWSQHPSHHLVATEFTVRSWQEVTRSPMGRAKASQGLSSAHHGRKMGNLRRRKAASKFKGSILSPTSQFQVPILRSKSVSLP